MVRRIVLMTAALVAAVLAYGAVAGPPRRHPPRGPMPPAVWPGAYHVHSTRSDGTAGPDAIAAAASHAGLRFVILTDHGDATRAPDPPRYVDGVLVIDAVEVSAQEGHIVALGLTDATPYPLGGEARDVIEDVHRMGGMAIVAHPDSRRDELRWRPVGPETWRRSGAAPGGDLSDADGVEWLNADSAWREHSWTRLAEAATHAMLRAPETMASLYGRPEASLARWNALAQRRTVVGLAAHDAHRFYAPAFASLAQVAVLATPASGDAASDAAALLAAIREGRTFSTITGYAGVAVPTLTATDGVHVVGMGDRLIAPAGPVKVEALLPGAPDATLTVRRDDRVVATGTGRAVITDAEPGPYRLEAMLGGRQMPWIVTTPVYVDSPRTADAPPVPLRTRSGRPAPDLDVEPVSLPLAADGRWRVEHSPSSTGTIRLTDDRVALDYAVGRADGGRDYVALSRPLDADAAAFDRLELILASSTPARVQIQFRLRGGHDQERWGRSVYVDPTPRPVTVRLADAHPIGFGATRRPIAAHVESVLLVLAWPTTAPGATGRLTVSSARLIRGDSGADGQQQVERPGEEQQVRRPGREGGR